MTTRFDPAIAAWLAQEANEPAAADECLRDRRISARLAEERLRILLGRASPPRDERDTIVPAEPAVPVRVLTPPDPPAATIVYLHGGGWVIGDLDTHLQHGRRLCVGVPARVVLVDYRLAPEHPFPAAFDDCLAATRAAAATSDEPLIVAGDSAGGQLAASVALACRNEQIPLGAQVLVSPAVDLRGGYADPAVNTGYPSRGALATGYGLELTDMAAFTSHCRVDEEDWRASPIVGDLRGVAPAIVHTAGYDLLQDEGRAYAAALERAGTPVVHRHWPSLNHSFFGLGGVSPAAEKAARRIVTDVRDLLRSAI